MATINFNGQDINIWTEESKEQYCVKAENMAKNYEALKEFMSKVFRPIIDEFNGKQANNRFVLALQQKALEVDESIIVEGLNRYDDNRSSISVSTTHIEGMAGRLVLFICEKHAGSDQRLINAAATLHDCKPSFKDSKEQELQELADSIRETITNYDQNMLLVAELKTLLDKYNHLAWPFHSHINKYELNVY